MNRAATENRNRNRHRRRALVGRTVTIALIFGVIGWGCAAARADPPPRVAASIAPLHSLVASIMQGVGEPALLVPVGGSPHGLIMRPSMARALAAADIVFWIGPALEPFLIEALDRDPDRRVVAALDMDGIKLLPARESGLWHDAEEADGHDHGPGQIDPHIWLDPDNARLIAATVARTLTEADPARAPLYEANAAAMDQALATLTGRIESELAPVRARPFITFHDAYQYFAARFGLRAVGAVSVRPDQPPGARLVRALKTAIIDQSVICVFAEPQFDPALIEVLIEGTPARQSVLDPIGSGLDPGPDLIAALLTRLAAQLKNCLAG